MKKLKKKIPVWRRIVLWTTNKVKSFFYVKKSRRKMSLRPWRISILLSIILILIFSSYTYYHINWALSASIPFFGQLQNRLVEQSTKIFDRSGNILLYDTTGSMKKITIPLEKISPNMILATIAVEDASYYKHNGINLIAIFRSILKNISSGSFEQGGSTITQQVIKNTILTKDKKISRKIREWVLALRIENNYSKNEILEIYLNETPYGGTIYGVEQASQEYFGKSAIDLTIPESAYLASMPKAPSYFSPWGPNFDLLTKRQNLVLKQMFKNELITKEEYEEALTHEVIFIKKSTENIKAPHFVFYVLEELEKKYGKERVYNGKLQVITTLDWDLQQESEKIISAGAYKNEKTFQASNAGLVAIDPQTGQVLAMVGSRNYFDDSVDGQVNVALALRQPGSTFKPFAYATAFKKGYTPDTILFDLRTQFSTACAPSNLSNEYPCYSPVNYNDTYVGPISMRDALAQSINVVGVKTLYLSGLKEVLNTARSLGVTTLTDEKYYGLSLVLGGGEVTLLEMTSAYSVFANDGIRHPITPILAIHHINKVPLEIYKEKPDQVLDEEVARLINDVLSDNKARIPALGANSPLYFDKTVVASKTGTTNDYRDVWVIGYTPSIVIGTWAGNNDNSPMDKKTAGFILAPIWHQVMEKANSRFPSLSFTPPESKTESLAKLPTTNIDIYEYLKPNDPQFAHWQYPIYQWANFLTNFLLALETTNQTSN